MSQTISADDDAQSPEFAVEVLSEPDKDAFEEFVAETKNIDEDERAEIVDEDYIRALDDLADNWGEFCEEHRTAIQHAVEDPLYDYYDNPRNTVPERERMEYNLQVWESGWLVDAVSDVPRDTARTVENHLSDNGVMATYHPEIVVRGE